MISVWILPFVLQGLLIVTDEVLHLKRDLPRWEKLGHPIDSFFYLLCFLWVLQFSTSPVFSPVYLGLAILSCVIITKDEFVHAKVSSGFENWLHSFLFILHPVCVYSLWRLQQDGNLPSIRFQAGLVAACLIYQTVYWNVLRGNLALKRVLLHLRIPFSFFLAPVFFYALATAHLQSSDLQLTKAFELLLILFFCIFPASNAYNSHYDEDKGSIGGMENPPPLPQNLHLWSMAVELVGLVAAAFLFSPSVVLWLFLYGVASKLYSHPKVRLKKYPWGSWLIVVFFQGVSMFWVTRSVLSPIHWDLSFALESLIAGLLIGAAYPLTQIYQHEEDQDRGDMTLSLKLGVNRTFLFSRVGFMLLGALVILDWGISWPTAIFLLCSLPSVLSLELWSLRSRRDKDQIHFRPVHRFMMTSAGLAIAAFILVATMPAKAGENCTTSYKSTVTEENGEPWFMMKKSTKPDGENLVHEVVFSDAKGNVLQSEKYVTDNQKHLLSYEFRQNQTEQSGKIRLEKNKIYYEFQTKSKKSEKTEDIDSDQDVSRLIVPPQIQDFAVNRWDEIQSKGKSDFSLLVPDRMETFSFKLENTKKDPLKFTLTARNFFVGLVAGHVHFVFSADKTLQEVQDFTPPVKFSKNLSDKKTNLKYESCL